MCWSASVSLNTFLFSAFAVALARFNGVIGNTGLVLWVSFITMQLIEYFLWTNLASRKRNRLFSQAALLLILLQPAASILTLEPLGSPLQVGLLVAYVLSMAVALGYATPWSTLDFRSVPAQNGHLAWKWLGGISPAFLLLWFFFFLAPFLIGKDYASFAFAATTALVTFVLFRESETWGSLWCWVANFASLWLIGKVFYKEFCPPPPF